MTKASVTKYTAITFAPVQGFIEKSRKLRDLYGASLILSYLSQQIVLEAEKLPELKVISPGSINLQKGMPNRILIKGIFSEDDTREVLLSAWKDILGVCQNWITRNLKDFEPYSWEREWENWGNHTWEIFWGTGSGSTEAEGIIAAMENLETRKLSRAWTALNWIGESSSLTGTDGIAFPGLGGKQRNPKNLTYRSEKTKIEEFYTRLAEITEEPGEDTPEGKFIALNEKLSIPELVKRLVTRHGIADEISKKRKHNPPFDKLPQSFKEIQRKPIKEKRGQWTGWFIGDGDKVGKKLKEIARKQGEQGLETFTLELRKWGEKFYNNFAQETIHGRVVYAGGDDFLGVIFSNDTEKYTIKGLEALEWLMTLRDKWNEHGQDITLSVGFVWVAGSVPQRDVLQHCREAEKLAKSLGRDRVTIRIVFNSGQYVQWTCPWDYLHILKKYRDRDGKTFAEWECKGRKPGDFPNWTHVYSDLAQLKARNAINLNKKQTNVDDRIALELFNIYFDQQKKYLETEQEKIVGKSDNLELIKWIDGLIHIGWHLCSNI